MSRFKRFIAAWALAGATGGAHAGPMGYADSTMAMGDFGRHWREAWVNHAVTARDAVGIGHVWMRDERMPAHHGPHHSPHGLRATRSFTELTYTRRVARWNGEHSQANLWAVVGVGPVRGNDFSGSRTMWAPGVSADWETTRLYLAGALRLYRAQGLNHDYAALRAGFSFYEVDFDQVQPWLVVEARRVRGLSAGTEVMPMLRLIHKNYFVEAGINRAQEARFNFMYIF